MAPRRSFIRPRPHVRHPDETTFIPTNEVMKPGPFAAEEFFYGIRNQHTRAAGPEHCGRVSRLVRAARARVGPHRAGGCRPILRYLTRARQPQLGTDPLGDAFDGANIWVTNGMQQRREAICGNRCCARNFFGGPGCA